MYVCMYVCMFFINYDHWSLIFKHHFAGRSLLSFPLVVVAISRAPASSPVVLSTSVVLALMVLLGRLLRVLLLGWKSLAPWLLPRPVVLRDLVLAGGWFVVPGCLQIVLVHHLNDCVGSLEACGLREAVADPGLSLLEVHEDDMVSDLHVGLGPELGEGLIRIKDRADSSDDSLMVECLPYRRRPFDSLGDLPCRPVVLGLVLPGRSQKSLSQVCPVLRRPVELFGDRAQERSSPRVLVGHVDEDSLLVRIEIHLGRHEDQ